MIVLIGIYLSIPKYYKIQQSIIHDQKLQQVVNNFKPVQIPTKKQIQKTNILLKEINYQRHSYTYSYDQNDTFYYDTLINKENKKTPTLIICFMGGHSKSKPIRRCVRSWFQAGHNCYVLIPRGAMETIINPDQQKFRSEGYDTEDINILIDIIKKEEKCQQINIVAYSLGCLQALTFLGSKESNAQSVKSAYLNFCYHYPEEFAKVGKRYQKILSSFIPKQLNANKQYYLNHGVTEEEMKQIINSQSVVVFDEVIWCPRTNVKTAEEYYHNINFANRLPHINKNTNIYFFNVADDFLTHDHYQYETIQQYQNVNLIVFNKGNHLGIITKQGDDLPSRLAVQIDQ